MIRDTEELDEDPDDDFGMGNATNKMLPMDNFTNACKRVSDTLPEQINILPHLDKFIFRCFKEM